MLVLVYEGRGVPYYAIPEVGGGGGGVSPQYFHMVYTCILWTETTLAFVVWEMVHALFYITFSMLCNLCQQTTLPI